MLTMTLDLMWTGSKFSNAHTPITYSLEKFNGVTQSIELIVDDFFPAKTLWSGKGRVDVKNYLEYLVY